MHWPSCQTKNIQNKMLTEMYPTQTAANVNTSVHKLIAKLQAEAQAHALYH